MRVDIDDDLVDAASKISISTGWVVMVGSVVVATASMLGLLYAAFFA